MKRSIITSLLLPILLLSCKNMRMTSEEKDTDTGQNEITFLVNHYKSVCKGEGVSLCFLVRKENDSKWMFMDENELVGLDDFEWGLTYKIKVVEKPVDPPMEDFPATFYQVTNIIVTKSKSDVYEDFEIPLGDTEMKYLSQKEGDYYLLDEVKVVPENDDVKNAFLEALEKEDIVLGSFQHSQNKNEIIIKATTLMNVK